MTVGAGSGCAQEHPDQEAPHAADEVAGHDAKDAEHD